MTRRVVALLPPDNGGWYTTSIPDWVALAPIKDSSLRAWMIMRGLVMEKRSPVRRLSLDELCKMLPMQAPDGSMKPSSLGRLRDIVRDLSAIGLISDPDGAPISTSSSKKAALQELSIRVNDWPSADYTGWPNGYAKLDAIRAGRPFDAPEAAAPPRSKPGPRARKPKAGADQAAQPLAPDEVAPGASGPGWISNQASAAGWISNQVGWNLDQLGWISNLNLGVDLGKRALPSISLPFIPLSEGSVLPTVTGVVAATVGVEEREIDTEAETSEAGGEGGRLPAQRATEEMSPDVQRVVAAWVDARAAAGFGPHRRTTALTEFTTSAQALVSAGRNVDWLVAVADWMGRRQPAWVGLAEATTAQYLGAPGEPKFQRAIQQLGACPLHPGYQADDCSPCRRARGVGRRTKSEPSAIAGDSADLFVALGLEA